MIKSLKFRIRRLESVMQPSCQVTGVRIDDGPVNALGQKMSLTDFELRYPEGQLIQIHLVNQPSDESRSPSP